MLLLVLMNLYIRHSGKIKQVMLQSIKASDSGELIAVAGTLVLCPTLVVVLLTMSAQSVLYSITPLGLGISFVLSYCYVTIHAIFFLNQCAHKASELNCKLAYGMNT